MTNYNERLDEILIDYADEHRNHAYEFDNKEMSQYEYFKSMRDDKEKAKQAITSHMKELVAEAKPYRKLQLFCQACDKSEERGHNQAIDQFEQNLLKALEEV